MTVRHAPQPSSRISVEDYLAFVATRPPEERWQLIDGVAMMMNAPTKAHQRVAANLARALNNHFEHNRPQYFAYQEVGLIVPEVETFRPQADVAVEDAAADYESYSDKFYLVAEVLSESNTDTEIEFKRKRYQENPDNLYVLIISQTVVSVTLYARAAGWRPVERRALDDHLDLPELGFSTTLRTIYAGTPLAKLA